jgi:demethylmenaquinone methyltransferase / 2-methoxy-6-polyprenyl-1,4-benzoquinol methylase
MLRSDRDLVKRTACRPRRLASVPLFGTDGKALHGSGYALPMIADAGELSEKRSADIQRMFSDVAPRYDLLNHLLSARRDVAWRKAAAAALDLGPEDSVLDICCGTGDQALAIQPRCSRLMAADFSLSMLALADRKFHTLRTPRPFPLAADSLRLPFDGDRFQAVTVSFGLRNVEDLDRALAEMHRVLAPGGSTAILEFATPGQPLMRRLYLLYFLHLLPTIGRWLSPRGSAYRYLPQSVLEFPQRQQFLDHMERNGFVSTAWRDLSGGIVCLYTGARAR